MRKAFIELTILMALILAGCLPQSQATPISTPTSTTTPKAEVNPPATTTTMIPTQAAVGPVAGCTVVTEKPTPGPTPVSIFPPVSASDWVKGPATARVTIIEYGDFQ